MTARTIGHRLFTDGVARPVYQDGRGQFIEEDGEGGTELGKGNHTNAPNRALVPRSVITSAPALGLEAIF